MPRNSRRWCLPSAQHPNRLSPNLTREQMIDDVFWGPSSPREILSSQPAVKGEATGLKLMGGTANGHHFVLTAAVE